MYFWNQLEKIDEAIKLIIENRRIPEAGRGPKNPKYYLFISLI